MRCPTSIAFSFVTQFASAAYITWSAAANGNWATSGNWTPAGRPSTASDVRFNGTSLRNCSLLSASTPASLGIDST